MDMLKQIHLPQLTNPKKSNLNDLGFGLVEGFLVIFTLLIIGLGGWFIYQHNRTKTSDAVSNTQTNVTSTEPKTEPGPTVTYLEIKEWGVKLPLSEAIKDAYYAVPTGISPNIDGKPSGIILGLASLDEKCGKVTSGVDDYSNALGGIVRALQDEKYPTSGRTYKEEYPIGVQIGDYYYGFGDMTSEKKCESQEKLSSIADALKNATKTAIRTSDTKN